MALGIIKFHSLPTGKDSPARLNRRARCPSQKEVAADGAVTLMKSRGRERDSGSGKDSGMENGAKELLEHDTWPISFLYVPPECGIHGFLVGVRRGLS